MSTGCKQITDIELLVTGALATLSANGHYNKHGSKWPCQEIKPWSMNVGVRNFIVTRYLIFCRRCFSFSQITVACGATWVHESWSTSLITRFMGPTWGPSGANRTQVGPMLAPWTLLSGIGSGNGLCVSSAKPLPQPMHMYCKLHKEYTSVKCKPIYK